MLLLICYLAALIPPPITASSQRLPAPRFTDPDRRSKLQAAFPAIDNIFESYYRRTGVPGLVYGIVVDGELAHVKSWGVKDLDSRSPVTAETVFRIASMTKSFTALAILKLRDEGKLSLDDPVSRWVPEVGKLTYPTKDSAPWRVRQLLTHTTGLPEDNPWGDRQLGREEELLTRWLKQGVPFSTTPGTTYEYSNYGFALAGRVIAKASGISYRQYLERHILAPLGMKASTLEPSAVPEAVRAMGYSKSGDNYEPEPSLRHGTFGAMGGLLTSARDLGRYVAYQLAAFPPRDEPEDGPVRRSSRREMQMAWRASGATVNRDAGTRRLQLNSSGYGYGLGVAQTCTLSHIVSHGGGLPGFGSFMVWLPEHGVGLFAMSNLTYSGQRGPAYQALQELEKTGALQPRQLPPTPALLSARDGIVKLWNHWDERAATQLAADNLFLDRSAEARRKGIEALKASLGSCRPAAELEPENWLRGRFQMDCEKGHVTVSFTLAPTTPPTVQYLSFLGAVQMSAAQQETAATLAASIGKPEREPLTRVAAPSTDAEEALRRIERAHQDYGSCRVGRLVNGDGSGEALVTLECDRGQVNLGFRSDQETGKLTGFVLFKPPDAACGF
jgi:CubicO group peptidase (beta-lactamase class C family)